MRLLTYPDLAKKGSKLWYICQDLGVEITQDFTHFDRAIYWNVLPRSVPDLFMQKIDNVINIRCTDVLKDNVDRVWGEISGCPITINPRRYRLKYVRKSKLQYKSHTGEKHDGRIFRYRQEPDPHYVYQKLVKTRTKRGYHTYRFPMFGRNIPFIVIKRSQHPFKEVKTDVQIIRGNKILNFFSKKELNMIRDFSHKIGADFAEIDVVRDLVSKEIYAIDVNNIAGDGIYGKLPREEVVWVRKQMCRNFKKLLK